MFLKQIIKINAQVCASLCERGLLKETITLLRLKRLYEGGFIFDWRNNREAWKIAGSKSTLIRHVNILKEEGLITENDLGIALIGQEKLIAKYGKRKFLKLHNDENLELNLKTAVMQVMEKRQKTKIFFMQRHSGKRSRDWNIIKISCLKVASMFGRKSSQTGYLILKELTTAGLIKLSRRVDVVRKRNLSYSFATCFKPNVMNQVAREIMKSRVTCFYNNDMVGA